MPFNGSVLRGMTNEELLREEPSELLCKLLMERMDEAECEEVESDPLQNILEEINEILENAEESAKTTEDEQPTFYGLLIDKLEKIRNQYS